MVKFLFSKKATKLTKPFSSFLFFVAFLENTNLSCKKIRSVFRVLGIYNFEQLVATQVDNQNIESFINHPTSVISNRE